MRSSSIALLMSVALLSTVIGADAAPPLLRETRRVELPGVHGRIDHMIADVANNKLYVDALGNNTVEIIDLDTGRVEKPISGLANPQGVLVVPEFKRLVVTNADSAVAHIFDSATLDLVGKIELRDDSDNIRYDPATHRAYVGCGRGRSSALAVLDVRAGAKLSEIELSGHPESFQLEARGTRIFVNVPAAQAVEVVDRSTGRVVGSWPLAARGNYPMALDEGHGRLFVGTRSPAQLLVLDTASGRVVASPDSVGDADDIAYDTETNRIYVSGGEGFVFVFEQPDADHYRLAGKIRTRPGARTSLYVQQWKTLFVALPASPGNNAELRAYVTAP
jgi:YVTN family beta-propeller protein